MLLVLGCEKHEEKPIAAADPAPSATAIPIATAIPTANATANANANATATANPTATAKPSATASATPTKPETPIPTPPPATLRKTADHAIIDLIVPPCTANTECAGTIRLEATDEFHINKEYPYKIVLADSPGVQFLGADGGRTFGRASGHFTQVAEKVATVALRFRPSAPGKMTLQGTFKMSVCSESVCKVDPTDLSLALDVR